MDERYQAEEEGGEVQRNGKECERSPRVIDIKWFYKESSSSEEERKKTKKTIKKIESSPKVVCHLVHSM